MVSRITKNICCFAICLFLIFGCTVQHNRIKIHYLGHSAFYISFGGEVSVLTDYGQENAYLAWGWDSPIHDAGFRSPDLLTYSHHHDDHYDTARAAVFNADIIEEEVDFAYHTLHIQGIPSSEKQVNIYDNISYLFTFRDLRVLHLGDCQADIIQIDDPQYAEHIRQRFPLHCDIVFLPIEGTSQYISQAAEMVRILQPQVVIPMHYWSDEYKQEFIDHMINTYPKDDEIINIIRCESPEYVYRRKRRNTDLQILDMQPAARVP